MKRLLFFLLLATSAFSQSGGQAVGIAIQNPSFLYGLNGWQCTYGCQVVQADNNGNALDAPAVDVGYGGSLSQVLTVSPKDLQLGPNGWTDGIYTIELAVRSGFGAYPGYFTVEVDFGTQELCEASPGWQARMFQRITVVCINHAYVAVDAQLPGSGQAQGALPLVLKFTVNGNGAPNGGWPILAKHFSLKFTPTN